MSLPATQENSNIPEMSIWGHLNELRKRLFYAVIGLAVTVTICFAFADRLMGLLILPIENVEPKITLITVEVTESIGVFMKVSLLAGFILALPFILFEILGFVMPGLTARERKWVYISIPMATIFFLGGVAFCYYIMLPAAIPFLVGFLGQSNFSGTVPFTPSTRLSNYFDFVLNLMFWIGVAFEMPLLMFVLAKLKIVTAKMLMQQWRIAIVVIAILSAVITPTPDPVNMGMLMLPLFALYLLSILFALIAQRGNKRAEEAAAAG